jgi:succinate dehydrogenase / fumarate reductase iron-sulfur subunit
VNTATFRVWRGDAQGGEFRDYATGVSEGMVVLDAVHQIQAEQANDLAVRWNCKAGKCGSCSAEVNGNPRLMCMTRLNQLDLTKPVTIEPMRAFPPIRDLVTDVSWNFQAKKSIRKFARKPDARTARRMAQVDVECAGIPQVHRVFPVPGRVPRAADHGMLTPSSDRGIWLRRRARDEPVDVGDRVRAPGSRHRLLQHHQVLHESLSGGHHDHDNAIIPLKERDRSLYDPVSPCFGIARRFPCLSSRPSRRKPCPERSPRPSATAC